MPVSKLKNLILLILLLCIIALLCLLIPRRLEQRREAQQLHSSLSSLCDSHNVNLDPARIPQTVTLYPLELAEQASAERSALNALIGEELSYEDGTIAASRAHGSWKNGTMKIKLTDQKSVASLRRAAKKELDRMAFQYERSPQPERRSPGTYTLWAGQTVLGVPVFSQGITLTYVNSCLTEISGDFYTGTLTRTGSTACMSASDAVVRFLSARVDLGWVGSSITALDQGYLPSISAGFVRLLPVWKLTTDTGSFYVNGITSEVFPADDITILT